MNDNKEFRKGWLEARSNDMWILLLVSAFIFGQDKPEKVCQPTSGDINLLVLDEVTARAKLMQNQKVAIVIVHLGKNENPKLNSYRIKQIKSYLLDENHLSLDKFVFAQGEPTNNYGKIEFYISGKLLENRILVADKNLGFPLCCDCPNSSFYTPKFIKHKKHLKRFSKSIS